MNIKQLNKDAIVKSSKQREPLEACNILYVIFGM